MHKRLSVYSCLKYGEKADTCSIFATVCPNYFEMCPVRVVYGSNSLNRVECSRIFVEILQASGSRFYYHTLYKGREEELKFIKEPPTKLFIHRSKFCGEGLPRHQLIVVSH